MTLLAAIVALGACAPAPVPPSPTLGPVGIASVSPEPTPTPAPSPLPSLIPDPGHELFGFVPYWEMDSGIAAHLRATPLSTLALFSVSTTASGAINTKENGYRRIVGDIGKQLVAEAHARRTRVELVYTSFGNEGNRVFFSDPTRMEASIASVVELVALLGMDGVNFDVEGLDPDLITVYGAFVARLREALVDVNPAAQVSVATTAGPIGAAMARAAIDGGADRDFLMGYDYHFSTSSPGAVAPVLRSDGSEKSLTWSLDLYIAAGVPPERTILGLPLYGMVWPVAGPVIGAPETGNGSTWIMERHVDLLTNRSIVPSFDPVEQVDVYFVSSAGYVGPTPSGADDGMIATDPPSLGASPGASSVPGVTWSAIYVDTPATLATKAALANARGLVGAGFWAIGYERGLPGFTDLMRRFVAGDALP